MRLPELHYLKQDLMVLRESTTVKRIIKSYMTNNKDKIEDEVNPIENFEERIRNQVDKFEHNIKDRWTRSTLSDRVEMVKRIENEYKYFLKVFSIKQIEGFINDQFDIQIQKFDLGEMEDFELEDLKNKMTLSKTEKRYLNSYVSFVEKQIENLGVIYRRFQQKLDYENDIIQNSNHPILIINNAGYPPFQEWFKSKEILNKLNFELKERGWVKEFSPNEFKWKVNQFSKSRYEDETYTVLKGADIFCHCLYVFGKNILKKDIKIKAKRARGILDYYHIDGDVRSITNDNADYEWLFDFINKL